MKKVRTTTLTLAGKVVVVFGIGVLISAMIFGLYKVGMIKPSIEKDNTVVVQNNKVEGNKTELVNSDENILAMTGDAALTTYAQNIELLSGSAVDMFEDMSNVWIALGETAYPDLAAEAFTNEPMMALEETFSHESNLTEDHGPAFTQAQRDKALTLDNAEALLQKSVTINFVPNSAVFLDQEEAAKSLMDFVKIAKALNGAIIQIEGNIADTGVGDTEEGRNLSLQRAKAVATFLKAEGIDNTRFVIVGNGVSNQISDNKTEESMAMNRRTDVYFKIIE